MEEYVDEPMDELETEGESEETEGEPQDDEALREEGRKALLAERKKARAFATELRKAGYTINKDGSLVAPKRQPKKTVDEDEVKTSAYAEAEKSWAPRLVTAEAVTALIEAGYKGNPRRGVRLLDLDQVGVSDGKVDAEALRDAIEELREDSPREFKRQATDSDDEEEQPRRHTLGSADIGRKSVPRREIDPLEEALNKLSGNAGNMGYRPF